MDAGPIAGLRNALRDRRSLDLIRRQNVESWVGTVLILGGWVALQLWILPRLGVPT